MRGAYAHGLRVLLLIITLALSVTTTASAGQVTVPMRDALDTFGASYAETQGWQYVDRLATLHGDYRRAYATLVFTTTFEGTAAGHEIKVPAEFEVEARVARCGPGWYVVSTPLDRATCGWWRLPRW